MEERKNTSVLAGFTQPWHRSTSRSSAFQKRCGTPRSNRTVSPTPCKLLRLARNLVAHPALHHRQGFVLQPVRVHEGAAARGYGVGDDQPVAVRLGLHFFEDQFFAEAILDHVRIREVHGSVGCCKWKTGRCAAGKQARTGI
jgi:hypothetical protein